MNKLNELIAGELITQPKPFGNVNFENKEALLNAYMPNLKNGGLFIQTDLKIALQTKVMIIMSLPEEKSKRTAQGKVVWLSPKNAQYALPQGIGIEFDDNAINKNLRSDIEKKLAGMNYEIKNSTF